MDDSFAITVFPDEVWLNIFRFADLKTIGRLAQVSKHFSILCNDDGLWRHLLCADIGRLEGICDLRGRAKELCKRRAHFPARMQYQHRVIRDVINPTEYPNSFGDWTVFQGISPDPNEPGKYRPNATLYRAGSPLETIEGVVAHFKFEERDQLGTLTKHGIDIWSLTNNPDLVASGPLCLVPLGHFHSVRPEGLEVDKIVCTVATQGGEALAITDRPDASVQCSVTFGMLAAGATYYRVQTHRNFVIAEWCQDKQDCIRKRCVYQICAAKDPCLQWEKDFLFSEATRGSDLISLDSERTGIAILVEICSNHGEDMSDCNDGCSMDREVRVLDLKTSEVLANFSGYSIACLQGVHDNWVTILNWPKQTMWHPQTDRYFDVDGSIAPLPGFPNCFVRTQQENPWVEGEDDSGKLRIECLRLGQTSKEDRTHVLSDLNISARFCRVVPLAQDGAVAIFTATESSLSVAHILHFTVGERTPTTSGLLQRGGSPSVLGKRKRKENGET